MRNVAIDRYSPLARVLHWVSAAVILWATVTGIYMALWAGPELGALISTINISVTTLLIPVFALRIAVRLSSPRPVPLDVPRRERQAAAVGHFLLYAMTTIVLVSGVLMMDRDIQVFDWLAIPRPLEHQMLNRIFFGIHRGSSALLGIMVLGHIGAVIRHERRGTRVLRRMGWPRRPVRGSNSERKGLLATPNAPW